MWGEATIHTPLFLRNLSNSALVNSPTIWTEALDASSMSRLSSGIGVIPGNAKHLDSVLWGKEM